MDLNVLKLFKRIQKMTQKEIVYKYFNNLKNCELQNKYSIVKIFFNNLYEEEFRLDFIENFIFLKFDFSARIVDTICEFEIQKINKLRKKKALGKW